jgi:hypothetical protein
MRADIRFAKARKNRPAPLGMTILRELAKAVLDENVVAIQTLKVRPPKEKAEEKQIPRAGAPPREQPSPRNHRSERRRNQLRHYKEVGRWAGGE